MNAEPQVGAGSKWGNKGVLAAAAFVMLVLLLVAVIPGFYDVRIRRTGDQLSQDIFPLLTTNDAITTAMVDQESGQRGYIITGVQAFLASYDSGRTRLTGLWQRAQVQAAAVSRRAEELLRAERAAAERWQNEAGEPEIALVRNGQTTAAVASVASGNGKALFDEYRARSTALSDYLDRVEHDKTALRSSLVRQLAVVQVVLALMALGGVGMLLYIVRHSQQDALRLVQAEADRRLRDEFLSAVSHDLRTPLATIKGMVQLSGRRAARMDTPEAARLVQRMNAVDVAVNRMSKMIDQLLDISRIQQGRAIPLDRAEVDLVALVQQRVTEQQQGSPRHRIVVAAAVPSLTGSWDKDRLERVLDNLLSNAIKYSPQGGEVNVTVAEEEQEGAPWARVTVRDHGVGIPAADLPHIFDRFYRAGNVRGQIGGVGIGLAGARQIVEHHGGTLLAESDVGRGATFIMRLPVRPPDDEDTVQQGETA